MICPYCKNEIKGDVKVCPNCKASVEKPKATKTKTDAKEK